LPKAYVVAGWDDVPHIDQATKDALAASYPLHERDVRTKGIPKLGSGAIYPVLDEAISVAPHLIPPHWPRLCAIDFGTKNPAAVWGAWDRDADMMVIYDAWKGDGQTVYTTGQHADIVRSRGLWIPCAWPHDGKGSDRGSGTQFATAMRDKGVNMLAEHAQHAEEGIGEETKTALTSVEGGLKSIYDAMMEGRFKVFSHLSQWFDEKNLYHRKDGKIVKERDHLMDAGRYLWISRRFAQLAPNQTTGRRERASWKTV